MGEIAVIILAAGESKRMNEPKMLLPFRGKTIIETVIENVKASLADLTIVVVGAEKDKVIEVIKKYQVGICYNSYFKQGMLSSVKCGFARLPDSYDAALVLLGDQPMISAASINKVITGYRSSGKGLVMPVYSGKRGHPLLISSRYKEIVEHLEDKEAGPADLRGQGLRALLKKYPGDVLEVVADSDEILRDIDTQEDYQKEIIQNH
jgi:molybdenum cofactor cytidylyltransferase